MGKSENVLFVKWASAAGTPPNLMITVDQVQLEPSYVIGTIMAINTNGNPEEPMDAKPRNSEHISFVLPVSELR